MARYPYGRYALLAIAAALTIYASLYLVLLAPLALAIFYVAGRNRRLRAHSRRRTLPLLAAAAAAVAAWLGGRPARKAIREQNRLTERERDELAALRAWYENTYGKVPF